MIWALALALTGIAVGAWAEAPAAPGQTAEDTSGEKAEGTETEETEPGGDQTHAGHQLTLRLGEEETIEPRGESGHVRVRVYELYCQDCGQVIARTDQREETPEAHVFPENGWQTAREATCAQPGEEINRCALCGYAVTRETEKVEHTWAVVSMQEPTCTQPGILDRVCQVCGTEERLESPALEHLYEWVTAEDGTRAYQCLLCGDILQTESAEHSDILYNNTITSFGPTTRELIGGNLWNRITPLDISVEGVFTYPLIASNMMSVGTATVEIGEDRQIVSYQLNSSKIVIHSESLVFYPDLDALRTGQEGQAFNFGEPIDLKASFGEDTRLIMSITLKADYDYTDPSLQRFVSDEAQVTLMSELLD